MSESKERPILFSSEMVRAILEGRKTQTRRAMKVQPFDWATEFVEAPSEKLPGTGKPGHWLFGNNGFVSVRGCGRCPYGSIGDRLWVRETWQVDAPCDGTWDDVVFYGCKGASLDFIPEKYKKPEHILYKATWEDCVMSWRPSIHMPRWASRITLEIVNVRVERVQDISEEDAAAEGLEIDKDGFFFVNVPGNKYFNKSAKSIYAELWNKIYGSGSWEANPWVWVIEFKAVDQ